MPPLQGDGFRLQPRQKGHIGHGSDETDEQIHVPFAVFGDDVPVGRDDGPTAHADVVPTLFLFLGDRHAASLYADRFVRSTVGWEPLYAIVGPDLKVRVYAGGSTTVTDPDDRPLPDADARLARSLRQVMAPFGREPAAPGRVRPGTAPRLGSSALAGCL